MKKLGIILTIASLLTTRAWGLFGVGDTVIVAADPLRDAQWATEATRWAQEIAKWNEQIQQYRQMLEIQNLEQTIRGDPRTAAATLRTLLPALAAQLGGANGVNLPGIRQVAATSNPAQVLAAQPLYYADRGVQRTYVNVDGNYYYRDQPKYQGFAVEMQAMLAAEEANQRLKDNEQDITNRIVALQREMATVTMTEAELKVKQSQLDNLKATLELYRIQQERTFHAAQIWAQRRESEMAFLSSSSAEANQFERQTLVTQAVRAQNFVPITPTRPPPVRLTP